MRYRLIASFITLSAMLSIAPRGYSQAPAPAGSSKAMPAGIPDLSGDWNAGGGCGWNPADPGCKKIEDGTPYQPWALAKVKSERTGYGPNQTFDNTTDPYIQYCDPMVPPRLYFNPSKFRFLQNNPDNVYILYEYGPYWLPVAMNRKHPADVDTSWWGDSVGWYEGDTLVIDTVGMDERSWLDQVGRPHTDALHMIQRFHRVDHDHLQLDITFDDPKAYTKPWTGKRVFTLGRTPFAKEMWVCTYRDLHKFDNDVVKPTVGSSPAK